MCSHSGWARRTAFFYLFFSSGLSRTDHDRFTFFTHIVINPYPAIQFMLRCFMSQREGNKIRIGDWQEERFGCGRGSHTANCTSPALTEKTRFFRFPKITAMCRSAVVCVLFGWPCGLVLVGLRTQITRSAFSDGRVPFSPPSPCRKLINQRSTVLLYVNSVKE